jgi:hypothetical protein
MIELIYGSIYYYCTFLPYVPYVNEDNIFKSFIF